MNGYWNTAGDPGSTMASRSPAIGIVVRSRRPFIKLTIEVRSSYQSPPPPYLSRATPNEWDPGGEGVSEPSVGPRGAGICANAAAQDGSDSAMIRTKRLKRTPGARPSLARTQREEPE